MTPPDETSAQIRRHRRPTRLRDYDYALAGAYFVTICTRDRACLLGDVIDGSMCLNDTGAAVDATWRAIPDHLPTVSLDEFVVMPNHVHGVLILTEAGGIAPAEVGLAANQGPMNRPLTLGGVVRAFKARVTRSVGRPVWQRNYYEHVIRNDESLHRIRQYIRDNPAQWDLDRENPRGATNPRPPSWAGPRSGSRT